MAAVPCKTCPTTRICLAWNVGCHRELMASLLKAGRIHRPLHPEFRARFVPKKPTKP